MTHPSLIRHRNGHLAGEVQAAVAARQAEQDDPPVAAPVPAASPEPLDVLAQLRAVNAATLRVLQDARASGDGRLVLLAVDRVQKQIELSAKLLGDLDERPMVNVWTAPEWLTIETALLDVLQAYPDARYAVAARLDALRTSA
jgi:hypothetical protein